MKPFWTSRPLLTINPQQQIIISSSPSFLNNSLPPLFRQRGKNKRLFFENYIRKISDPQRSYTGFKESHFLHVKMVVQWKWDGGVKLRGQHKRLCQRWKEMSFDKPSFCRCQNMCSYIFRKIIDCFHQRSQNNQRKFKSGTQNPRFDYYSEHYQLLFHSWWSLRYLSTRCKQIQGWQEVFQPVLTAVHFLVADLDYARFHRGTSVFALTMQYNGRVYEGDGE